MPATMLAELVLRGPAGLGEQGLGDKIPEDCNLYYLGGGQDRDQLMVAQDLVGKADPLRRAVDNGAEVLAVCGGCQLVGHSYAAVNGQEMAGTGLLDLETTAGTDRLIGDVVLSVDLDGEDGLKGAVSGCRVGTYLHGPLSPKNPWLADTLLR